MRLGEGDGDTAIRGVVRGQIPNDSAVALRHAQSFTNGHNFITALSIAICNVKAHKCLRHVRETFAGRMGM